MTKNTTRSVTAVISKYNTKDSKEGYSNVHMNITLHTNKIDKFIYILKYLLLIEDT